MKKFAIILAVLLSMASAYGQQSDTNQKRWAVVELSAIYMRIAPDYESALETQELMGTAVEIVTEKGYWREIVSPQPYRAWCTEKGIVEMSGEEMEKYTAAPKCMFTGLYGHIYAEPSEKASTICDLVGGDIMRLAGKKGRKWTNIILPSGKSGWVKSDCVKEHQGFRSIAKGTGNSDSISDKEMEEIISTAEKLVGVPYLWGGMTPKGVDCSGLVRWSCLMNGILLPRNASQMVYCGEAVSTDDLKRGDLVFFGTPAKDGKPQKVTHVGIYIGNGRIIHASHIVRINSLIPTEDDYYENAHKLIAARRL